MKVVVVGGGLSGLFTACELFAAGIDDLVVVEKATEPGGVTQTIVRDGFMLEPGAGSFPLPLPDLSAVLDRFGADVVPADASASIRYVYTRGRLVSLPASPMALLAPLVPIGSKLRALSEPLIRSRAAADESLEDFCVRRFGKGAGEMLGWLMASGVFAGDPRRLSAMSAFPALTVLEDEVGSVIKGALRRRRSRPFDIARPVAHVPVGGMSALARSAAGLLGERFRAGFEVGSVRKGNEGWVVEGPEVLSADAVVITSGPGQASEMLEGDLAALLARAASAAVVVAGIGGLENSSLIPEGFGALIHARESMISRGLLFESSYAPDRAPDGSWLVKVVAGGATNPDLVEWDDRRLVDRLVGEVSRVVGSDLAPTFLEIVRHRPGIPQYELGHERWLAGLESLLSKRRGLHLTGWGYRGVGVAQIASDARAVARELVSAIR